MFRITILVFFASLVSITLQSQDFDAAQIAKDFITQQNGSFIQKQFVDEELQVKSTILDNKSGLTHVYLTQKHQNIEIYNAISSVHISTNGSVFHHTNSFVEIKGRQIFDAQVISKQASIISAGADFGMSVGNSELQSESSSINKAAVFRNDNLSLTPIDINLLYVPIDGKLVLCWDVQFTKRDDHFMWNVKVDASNGDVVLKNTYTLKCAWGKEHDHSIHEAQKTDQNPYEKKNAEHLDQTAFGSDSSYLAIPIPAESPNHGPIAEVIRPWTAAPNASPYGWHDNNGVPGAEFTDTRGNNVDAYLDRDGNGVPGFRPDGGANLDFDFPFLFSESPVDYQDFAATNLFYMNNILHDVMYQYGFDAAGGNFQQNTYGNGGVGGDPVNAECQSGADVGDANNAFFGTPPDGSRPTMMMFEFTSTNPRRDSDLDNGIIAHEYGHGISNRLTGGPETTSCLSNAEQMGEGWSDFCTLILSMKPGDVGNMDRGVGTYVLGQPTDGPGIRTFPYTTDMTVNTHTYGDISQSASSHFRGSIWAEMLWEMTWALIDEHGFEPDIYNSSSSAGNIVALQLVNQGMKLQPCSPGFVDGRDGILAADMALYGGVHQCTIWEAFAKRGLGASADQGSSGSISDGIEAFDVPLSCLDTLIVTKTAQATANGGETICYNITVSNFYNTPLTDVVITDVLDPNLAYMAGSSTCGGTFAAGTLTIEQATMAPDEVLNCEFKARVGLDNFSQTYFSDDLESGTGNWTIENPTGSNTWSLSTANPNSPANAWFTPNSENANNTQSVESIEIALMEGTQLSFSHAHLTELGWDGGIVEISTNSGGTWSDLGPFMTQNEYNGTLGGGSNGDVANRDAFTGNSSGYKETKIDLSSFGTQTVKIRFLFGQDDNTFGVGANPGWFVDDIELIETFVIENTVMVTSAEGDMLSDSASTVILECMENCFTCTDGIQNGDESGVDCGGSFCPDLCPCTTEDTNLNYMSETVPDGTNEHVLGTINANGAVIIGTGTEVQWRAGTAVNIDAEFTTESTGELTLDTEPCEPAKKRQEEEKKK